MRTILLLLMLGNSLSFFAQSISFEDAKFKAALIEAGFDLDADGEISETEALEVRQIKFANKELTSIKGIEYFKNVTWLDIQSNQLTYVDVRKVTNLQNFYIARNMISELHVTGLQRLSGISANTNMLSAIELSNLPRLANLYIDNNPFQTVDLSQLPNLQRINTSGTQITQLDFSNNPKLYGLTVNNSEIAELDLRGLCSLNSVNFRSTPIKNLDLTDCINLKSVLADGSQLETLIIKNESSEVNLNFGNLTNLQSICADESEIDTLSQLLTELGYINVVINSSCEGPDLPTFYTDNDRDGYGDESTAEKACIASSGKVSVAGDCDDTNININPGATEIPNNGIDENCDGADETTAVSDLNESQINIYPNPASELLYLESEAPLKTQLQLALFSTEGRQVARKMIHRHELGASIDIRQLSAGLYILHIQENEKSYKHLVVVAR